MKTILEQQDNYFFALLRIGLWQEISSRDSEILKSRNPEIDWEYIYKLACEQTVQGIIADGIGIYRKATEDLNSLNPLSPLSS